MLNSSYVLENLLRTKITAKYIVSLCF